MGCCGFEIWDYGFCGFGDLGVCGFWDLGCWVLYTWGWGIMNYGLKDLRIQGIWVSGVLVVCCVFCKLYVLALHCCKFEVWFVSCMLYVVFWNWGLLGV